MCGCTWEHTHTFERPRGGQKSMLDVSLNYSLCHLFLDIFPPWTYSWFCWTIWPASPKTELRCPRLSKAWIEAVWHSAWVCLLLCTWVLGIELGSPCLLTKHFINWAISLALIRLVLNITGHLLICSSVHYGPCGLCEDVCGTSFSHF